jgi:hypothetical protein
MDNHLLLDLWNANGLTQHAEELRTFISYHNIDIMLISETHFTERSYFRLPFYSVYHTNRPREKCHLHKKLYPALLPQRLPTSYYGIGGKLHWFTKHFGCLSPTQTNRHTGAARHLLQLPWELQ